MSTQLDGFAGHTVNSGDKSDHDANNNSNELEYQTDIFQDLVVKVNSTDMEAETLKFCIEQTQNGISVAFSVDQIQSGFQQDKNSLISKTIKKELDRVLRPTWHVIVGDHYGSFVTHERGSFVAMTVQHYWITIFRSA